MASERPALKYIDPKPQHALKRCLDGASEVWAQMESGSTWVDQIEESVVMKVRVESDWTSHYSRTFTVTVGGPKLLHLGRLFVSDDVGHGALSKQSIADVPAYCREDVAAGKPERNPILVPAINQGRWKGFLVFYDPPIAADDPRTFETGFTLNKEFEKSLGMGGSDGVSLSLQQRAHTHRIKDLKFEFWFHPDLPDVEVSPQFRSTTALSTASRGRHAYRVMTCTYDGQSVINAQAQFSLTLTRS